MIFIDACLGKKTEYTPVWMMRQAGRYLKEYREIRNKFNNFIDMTKNIEAVTEITLQPVEILDVDAAILFSDILNLPMEMGLKLRFEKEKGPIFDNPINNEKDLDNLDLNAVDKLDYVFKSITSIRSSLSKNKALIGFAGSPWTIATYMVEGKGTKLFAKIKKEIYSNPMFMHRLLSINTKLTTQYLIKQIESGADAVMIFDSWGGALERDKFFEFSWNYMKSISISIKSKYPSIPVILFSKGVGLYMEDMDGEFDVIGVDWSVPIEYALNIFSDNYTIQGNLDPARLYSKTAIKDGVQNINNIMKGHRHIFNLGHGIFPDTPVENAKYFVNLSKEISKGN